MTLTESLTILAIILGPVISIIISLWSQKRWISKEAKKRSFLMLMAYRKNQLHPDRLNSLNTIDVVWGDHKNVVRLWHDYYAALMQAPESAMEQWNHTHLKLLHAMAQVLGYKNIEQVDIGKFYSPEGVAQQILSNYELQQELLRVLRATSKFETAENKDNS